MKTQILFWCILCTLLIFSSTSCKQMKLYTPGEETTVTDSSYMLRPGADANNDTSSVTYDDLLNDVTNPVSSPSSTTTTNSSSSCDLFELYWLAVIEAKKEQDITQIYKTFGRGYDEQKIRAMADAQNKYNADTYLKNKELLDKLLNDYIQGAAKRITIDRDGIITVNKNIIQATKTPKVK